MKDIEITLNEKNIKPNSVIKGKILVGYAGKYDGIVINTQIRDSNELIIYKSFNEIKISDNVSRLFISKENMPNNEAEFTAAIVFEPKQEHEVKFRVSIIEQHKEIESDMLFAKFSA